MSQNTIYILFIGFGYMFRIKSSHQQTLKQDSLTID